MNKKPDLLQQEEQLVTENLQTKLLTPNDITFYQTDGGFAGAKLGEKTYEPVQIIRTFPFTDPDAYLSVREEKDNRELGIIESLFDFDKKTIAVLESQLAMRYFTPKITKINHIKEQHGYSYWQVETDKGNCKFTCDQNGVIKLSATRLLIVDVDGNRFELPNITRLSAKELRMVDLYI